MARSSFLCKILEFYPARSLPCHIAKFKSTEIIFKNNQKVLPDEMACTLLRNALTKLSNFG